MTSKKQAARQPFDIRHCLSFSPSLKLREIPDDTQHSFAKLSHNFYKLKIFRGK